MNEIFKAAIIAGIILPLAMAMSVGAYGLIVWLLQMFVIGLPTA